MTYGLYQRYRPDGCEFFQLWEAVLVLLAHKGIGQSDKVLVMANTRAPKVLAFSRRGPRGHSVKGGNVLQSEETIGVRASSSRIVLLESNELIRQAVEYVLALAKAFEVRAAGSLGEVKQAIADHDPEFLILRSGWPLIQVHQLLSTKRGMQLIVIVSGRDREHLAEASVFPAAGFIFEDEISPDSMESLASAIRLGKTPMPYGLVKFFLDHPTVPSDEDEYLLTPREFDVLRELVAGRTNSEIAASLGMSDRSARRHVEMILAKLNSTNRTSAAIKAIQEGLVRRHAHR